VLTVTFLILKYNCSQTVYNGHSVEMCRLWTGALYIQVQITKCIYTMHY